MYYWIEALSAKFDQCSGAVSGSYNRRGDIGLAMDHRWVSSRGPAYPGVAALWAARRRY